MMGKQQVDYKRRMNSKHNQKAKVLATLFTAATIVAAPVSINYSALDRGLELNGVSVDAASVSLLNSANLNASYSGGKLILTITGNQLVNIAIGKHYHPYFKLADELKPLLSHPSIRANTRIDYDIPYLQGFSTKHNTGTVTGSALKLNPTGGTVGADISNGLRLSVGGQSVFTLTIDLAAIGTLALPAGLGDNDLDFFARVGDGLLDIDLLGTNSASAFIVSLDDADADADA
ncbi:Lmo1799 family Asp-Ala repeat surface protein, partial [Paenilisteria newyorkensis]